MKKCMAGELFLFIGVGVLFIVVELVLATLFLMLAMKIVSGCTNTEFGTVFVTAILMALLGMVPIIGCILQWWLLQNRHTSGDWGKAIVVWLLAGLLPLVVVMVILFVAFPAIFTMIPLFGGIPMP